MEWKWIDNYENRYKIYINGDVESCIFKKKKMMNPSKNTDGYLQIGLTKKGEKLHKFFLIHRLIAIHFIPNPEDKPFIDHKDGNKLNNSLENLRWTTHQENMLNQKNFGKYKKGVYFSKSKKFIARLTINGKRLYLGSFETEDEAHQVYKAKFLELHGYESCSR